MSGFIIINWFIWYMIVIILNYILARRLNVLLEQNYEIQMTSRFYTTTPIVICIAYLYKRVCNVFPRFPYPMMPCHHYNHIRDTQ